MGRRHVGWPDRVPRPKAGKLSKEVLQRLQARAAKFVQGSIVLNELLEEVQLARGRLYFWQELEDLMVRIAPLGPRATLLETPRGNSWIEHERGQLATVLKYVESDTRGSFHGLGSLVAKRRGSKPSVQRILHSDFKVPNPGNTSHRGEAQ